MERSPRRSIGRWTRGRLLACLFLASALDPVQGALAASAEDRAALSEAPPPFLDAAPGIEPARQFDILVTAPWALLNAVPERSLDAADVEAYGLGTVGEVVAELAAEDGETRDDPAYLINGKRIQEIGDVADLPAEAIVRIDVLPPGTGVGVGAAPRQRVYNIRLRRELDLAVASGATRAATAGGWSAHRGEVSYTHIRADRRITLAAKLRDEGMLLESERRVLQPPGSLADAGRLRSLSGANDRVDFSLSAADRLTSWLSASLGARLAAGHRHALLGPFPTSSPQAEPLDQRGRTLLASVDLTLNGEVGRWQLGLMANYAYRRARTLTEHADVGAAVPLAVATGSNGSSLGAQANAFGPLVRLPAGDVVLNVSAALSSDTIEGRHDAQAGAARRLATLTSTSLGAGIEIPIASNANGGLAGIGDLSVSAEASLQHSSDFGRVDDYNVSLLWRPAEWISVTGSVARRESAPPVTSLSEPALETPGIRYFDPLRGETVDVTRITGGVPGLRRQSDRTRRLAVSMKPVRSLPLRVTSEYSDVRNLGVTSELPAATLSLLQAFPERFIRNSNGRLIAVDARPVSFARHTERQVRTSLLLNMPLGKAGQGRSAMAEDEDEASGARVPSRGTALRPRLQISASHSWLLESKLAIRPGGPAIDLLSTEAVGFGGGGRARHRLEASVGYAERGLGVRASVQSRGGSFVEASGSTPNVLRFNPLTTFSLRAWVQGERVAPRSGWMKGTRLSLSLVNATGRREQVVDRFGATPLSYQAAYRDPVGRSFEIELRKRL